MLLRRRHHTRLICRYRIDRFQTEAALYLKLRFRGIHNGNRYFLLRIRWSDATKNDRAIKHEQFRDAVGLMFPLGIVKISPETPFSPRMGDRGKTVNIWHWKADWERDLQADGGFEHMKDQFTLTCLHDFDSDPTSLYLSTKQYTIGADLLAGGYSCRVFTFASQGHNQWKI